MSKTWTSLLFETCEAGISSALAPELLPDNQNAWMLNGQNRGGKPATRPNISWVLDLPAGLVQGCEFFSVQSGMMVASIAGRLYRIRLVGNQFDYSEIPLTFLNSPVVKQVWMTQTVESLVIQDGQSNAIIYDGSVATRSAYPLVPRGRQMAYGNGRLWVAVDANEVLAGNIRTGAPGSELKFTEGTYLLGGGKLFFPNDITGMSFIPVTGQSDYGALLVFGAGQTNAIRADITSRDDWGKIPGFVTAILRSVGAASQWSIASVNQDLYWRDSNRGIRSIRNALANEAGPGSSPLSREVSRLTDYDSQRQLAFCSSIYHDNRLLMTSSPFLLPNGGVGFKDLIALDFAPLSTMAGKSQAAYDGQWNGLNFVKLVGGEFRGQNRGFVISTDENGRNQLWELGTGARADMGSICVDGTADVEENPITCFVEYPLRNFGTPKARKRLERCDLWLSSVNGPITVKVYWRADNSVKWLLWDEAETCAKTSDASTDTPHVWKNLRPQERPQFKTFTIPDAVNDITKYAAQVGFEFQIRVVWTGRMKIHRMMTYGTVLDDPDYADRSGFEIQCVEDDISGNNVDYVIPNAGCSLCPEITVQPVSSDTDGGGNAVFSVEVEGEPDAYQWQVSADAGDTWTDVTDGGVYSGATTAELTVADVDSGMSGLLYRCVINRGGCGPDQTTTFAMLTVTCQDITAQPEAQEVPEGDPAAFSVTASLAGATYRWQLSTDGGSNWSNLSNISPYSGVNTANLAISATSLTMDGYLYRCIVGHAGCGEVTSDGVLLSFALPVDYLLVGGGGGGGYRFGAGGGGGGYSEGSVPLDTISSHPVVVGGGGNGAFGVGPTIYQGGTGGNTSFAGFTAFGGGGGGGGGDAGNPAQALGATGGCGGGGGGGAPSGAVGSGAAGGGGTQGGGGGAGYFAGGDSVASGGGGGAGGAGGICPPTGLSGGNGGIGHLSSISGGPTRYGGGGGGSAHNVFMGATPGAGGAGGGGDGGIGTGGLPGSSGGGGGGSDSPVAAGGGGGNGLAIIRYLGAARFTGGVVSSSGGYTIHAFAASGSLVPI